MKVYAISDLHLSLKGGVLLKPMEVFGAEWTNHHRAIEADWRQHVTDEDVVLVPGDVSWASRVEGALEDLAWLDSLPGQKILIEGNHDWWSSSLRKARERLPGSIRLIRNDCVVIGDVVIFGSRMWIKPNLAFPMDDWSVKTGEIIPRDSDLDHKIWMKEIERLRLSISEAKLACKGRCIRRRICLTHFPPTDFNGCQTEATALLSEFGTDVCVFGHIHGFTGSTNGVVLNGVRYYLTTCDYLGFRLLCLPEKYS